MLAAEGRPWIEVSSREQREAVSSHLVAHPSTGVLVALVAHASMSSCFTAQRHKAALGNICLKGQDIRYTATC